ncbi:transposase [Pedobacter mendelii]|uniref:Transposase n=2 Tax=Pedobacter mendelii TaxID=1908240 RepID=A0ABQ2BFL0_9SPHI|nr:transposase [Pedobacter mendelii]
MIENIFKQERNSKMIEGEVYFWTDTIKDWYCVFENPLYKQVVLNTMKELVERKKVIIYAFVIMPNHLHIVWKMVQMNGKEMPYASFNKFTSHKIFEDMKSKSMSKLMSFKVDDQERKFRLWQRDPLAVLMDSKVKVEQKIDYIHRNPLQEKWSLCESPENYPYSSANFYMTGFDNFGFLTDYRNEFY